MTISVPYDWLPKITRSQMEKEREIPLFGYAPPFPWEEFAAILTQIFQFSGITFHTSLWEFRQKNQFYEGFGNHATALLIELSPLKGQLFFLISEEDLERLMNFLLTGNAEASTLIDTEYREGFIKFLSLEIFNTLTRMEYAQGIVPHLSEFSNLPDDACICQDVTFEISGNTFIGRLIVTEELRRSWKERFAKRSLEQIIPANLEVTVHLEAGRVSLKKDEWEAVQLGDCLLLDSCTLENSCDRGRVLLTLNNRPIYRARVKDGNLKILETPFIQTVEAALSQPNIPLQKQEAQLPDTFDEEFTDFDEDFTEFDEIEEEEAHVAPPAQKPSRAPAPEALPESLDDELAVEEPVQATTDQSVASTVSLNDVPLNIVVEVGRIQISIQKFLELQPGNVLELDIHPENGVNLVTNGNVIAKGELLKIGDSLGVRILDKA